jgi:hypothetical protein
MWVLWVVPSRPLVHFGVVLFGAAWLFLLTFNHSIASFIFGSEDGGWYANRAAAGFGLVAGGLGSLLLLVFRRQFKRETGS